ncbi:ankyrin repeat-containing protein [Penicillium taxi]|uniref:ankyrin repeat-containing protein n=1 Tax=Penicillium taxi TaxID=168475 RepID=UPI0025453C3D|nr:ankyrin repeat-containing protein [Penicillium taxi]KAJ5894360.1 ankyrin repeat-containing protein [Penicillium taxi]
MLINPFRPYDGPPVYQEEYYRNSSYVPNVIKTWRFQIIAPDTPYVAAANGNTLYFIDTRFHRDTAQHIKNQIEAITFAKGEEYVAIDEFEATAELKIRETGGTTFSFDPAYARVLFARGINRQNPEIKLPEPKSGDWLVTYDLDEIVGKKNKALKEQNEDEFE